jgi:hypothetical protein
MTHKIAGPDAKNAGKGYWCCSMQEACKSFYFDERIASGAYGTLSYAPPGTITIQTPKPGSSTTQFNNDEVVKLKMMVQDVPRKLNLLIKLEARVESLVSQVNYLLALNAGPAPGDDDDENDIDHFGSEVPPADKSSTSSSSSSSSMASD